MIPQRWVEAYLRFLLRHRWLVTLLIAAITAGFAAALSTLQLHTEFLDFYPQTQTFVDAFAECRRAGEGGIPRCAARAALHPGPDRFIQVYRDFREMFGSANVLSMIVEVTDGDIYTPETLQKIDRLTRGVIYSTGVIPYQVLSIAHPRLRQASARAGSITLRPMYHPRVPQTDEEAEQVRRSVHSTRGVNGVYAALDGTAAVVHASFWEEKLDFERLYAHLTALQAAEQDSRHRIHITGLPWLYVSVLRYARQVAIVFCLTAVALAFLLYVYFRTWTGTWVPILSGVLSSIWGLGIAVLFGFHLDPLVLVIPVFLTARALSHSVQSMDRYHEELYRCGEARQAIVESYSRLFPPAIAAIVTDGISLLVVAVAPIPLIQKVAVFASFWIVSIFVSVVTLHPIILSFTRPAPRVDHLVQIGRLPVRHGVIALAGAALFAGVVHAGGIGGRIAPAVIAGGALAWFWWYYAERIYPAITGVVIAMTRGVGSIVIVAVAIVILVVGWSIGRTLRVGDLTPGAALLFEDHPYNVAFRTLNEKFLGASQLVVVADSGRPDGLRAAESLWMLDELSQHMSAAPGASASVSMIDIVKAVTRLLRDGDPKQGVVPVQQDQLRQFLAVFSNQLGDLDRFVDFSGRYATVTTLFRGYSSDLIEGAIAHAEHLPPGLLGEHTQLRLAGGMLGILAAVNRAVEHSYWTSVLLIFAVVFACLYLTYGSLAAASLLMVPVLLSQVTAEAVMVLWGIDLNVNSLPIAAAGAGVGVDYGIYLFSRIIDTYDETGSVNEAVDRAIATTGKAIIFTATTMMAATIFWWFSDLKFQAEMGLLLALLMGFNLFGGLVLVPALIKLLRPAYLTRRVPHLAQSDSRLAALLRERA
jgi:predicted RND superfamily exporter protein